MSQPQVTILIPNYKTPALTMLCLRLIRKYTSPKQAKVIVIDNDSQDASLDYLRSLTWIQLVEREVIANEGGVAAHSRALDLGLRYVDTPYVLSIHTDTLIKHAQWLDFLLVNIQKKPQIAGIGSWKLEAKPFWRRVLKAIERGMQLGYYHIVNQHRHTIEGQGRNFYYLRSHCAMYKMELIREFNLSFSSGDKIAGKNMHRQLVDAGYEMVFIPYPVLIRYLDHINHATTILNPELRMRGNSVSKGLRKVKKALAQMDADRILLETSLDY